MASTRASERAPFLSRGHWRNLGGFSNGGGFCGFYEIQDKHEFQSPSATKPLSFIYLHEFYIKLDHFFP